MGRWWIHTCKNVGETQIPYGEPCNWCDITEEDVEQQELSKPLDIIENIIENDK